MKTATQQVLDRLGNIYSQGDLLVKAHPDNISVDDMHFWCVVCKDIRPLDMQGGVVASIEIGGWMCGHHQAPSR